MSPKKAPVKKAAPTPIKKAAPQMVVRPTTAGKPKIPASPPPAVTPTMTYQQPPAAPVRPPAAYPQHPPTQHSPATQYPPTQHAPRCVRPAPQQDDYRPQQIQNNISFTEQRCSWLTEKGRKFYEPIVPAHSENHISVAFSPWPMYNVSDPDNFVSARYGEYDFEDWARQVPFIPKCGTVQASTASFIPYSSPDISYASFNSSPYGTMREVLRKMHKERPFQGNWLSLFTGSKKGGAERMANVKIYRFVVGVVFEQAVSVKEKGSDKWSDKSFEYVNPQTGLFGRGSVLQERLCCIAIPPQTWSDIVTRLNTRTADGGYAYPNPVDPRQLSVMYIFNSDLNDPVTNAKATQAVGYAGSVAYQYVAKGRTVLDRVALPQEMWMTNDEGIPAPTDEYFGKVIHWKEALRHLDDREQALLLAGAYANAKCLFEIGWKGTQFEDFLRDEEFLAKFKCPQEITRESNQGVTAVNSYSYQQGMSAQAHGNQPVVGGPAGGGHPMGGQPYPGPYQPNPMDGQPHQPYYPQELHPGPYQPNPPIPSPYQQEMARLDSQYAQSQQHSSQGYQTAHVSNYDYTRPMPGEQVAAPATTPRSTAPPAPPVALQPRTDANGYLIDTNGDPLRSPEGYWQYYNKETGETLYVGADGNYVEDDGGESEDYDNAGYSQEDYTYPADATGDDLDTYDGRNAVDALNSYR